MPAGRRATIDAAFALATRCDYEAPHTHQVTRLALRLFDALAAAHGLDAEARGWLECGALLHDIGWVAGRKGHHKTAARLIMEAEELPLDGRSRQIVACVARYHRKALPAVEHELFAGLVPDDRRVVCVLAGLLRVADGLDRSHAGVVDEVACEVSPDRAIVRVQTAAGAEPELWAARKKSDLLARALGRRVVIERAGDCRDGRAICYNRGSHEAI